MKLLVYTDGGTSSAKALRFAAQLAGKTNAELAIITVRSGTHAIEPPPPFGQDLNLNDRPHLPTGLQILSHALEVLCDEKLIGAEETQRVRLSELPHGHMFVCQSEQGRRIPFYVYFGAMIEILNREIDVHHHDLLIISPPQRSRLHKMMLGNTTRKLVLDLHTSVLIVKGGGIQSRYVVCADGSAAAGRQFSMLQRLLPAIADPLELVWVQSLESDGQEAEAAERYLIKIEKWLAGYGKSCKRLRLLGDRPAKVISDLAGEESVIFLGASLRHDVYRRLKGSLPMQILDITASSVLVAKGLPEDDPGLLQ